MTSRKLTELADLAVLGDPEESRARAEAVLATEEPSDRYKAADPSGSIWVSVDPRARLVDVEFSRTWSERLTPEDVGDALFGAYVAAAQKALVVEAAAREEPPPPRQRRPEPPAARPSTEELLAFVQAELDEADRVLRAAAAVTANVPAEQEIRGRNGYLTLLVRDGVPTGITASAAVTHANRGRLREDVLDIFHDAELAGDIDD